MISKIIAEDLIHKTQNEIETSEKVVIVTHVAPDGDALGSALGLWHYLMTIEKEPVVVVPSAYPSFFDWMPGINQVINYEKNPAQAAEHISAADLIFALDFNVPARLAKMSDLIINASAPVILVDHHLNPGDFAKVVISYPQISSTSELVFRLICRMGDFSKINLACAECIYTGMMTDTGGFTFNSNNAEIYFIVAELLKIGVDKDDIYLRVYNTFTENRLRLMGYCLYEKMKLYPEYQTALITLTLEEMKRFGFTNGDAEGFVNIPLSLEGVVFSVFIREDNEKIKVSLRSQGTFPANKFAADQFDGGGHLNASGGEFYGDVEEAVRRFEEALPLYKDFL